MIGGRSAYDLISARPAGRTEALDMYVKELGKAGFGVLFLAPGSADEIVDLRGPKIKKNQDADGPRTGVALAETDPKRLATYVTAAKKRWPDQPPNLAIRADRTIVVEAKGTAAEEFRSRYTVETENLISATLLLPDGGEQVWFEAPEGWALPEGTTELVATLGDDVTVRTGAVPIVIPPSVRADGETWQWVGEVNPAPEFLLGEIADADAPVPVPEHATPEPEPEPVLEDSAPAPVDDLRRVSDLLASATSEEVDDLEVLVRGLGAAGRKLVFLKPGSDDTPINLLPAEGVDDTYALIQLRTQIGCAHAQQWGEVEETSEPEIATSDPDRLAAAVHAAVERPNLAMAVDGLIVVHASTDALVELFTDMYFEATGRDIALTIKHPHRGGYFVFAPPAGWEPPDIEAAVFGKHLHSEVTVFWAGRFIPIPPTILRGMKTEDAYRWVGEVPEAHPAFLDAIAAQGIGDVRPLRHTAWGRYPAPDFRPRPARPLYPAPASPDRLREAFGIIARADEYPDLTKYVTALGACGTELIFLEPGTKDRPIDLRTQSQKLEDNDYAQERARRTGNPHWDKKVTRAGIQIATADPERLTDYVAQAKERYPDDTPNLAMLVRNLIVVDADWRAGIDFFIRISKEATRQDIGPTTASPGVRRADGTWKHHGGGHFYFLPPEGWELPEGGRTINLGEGDEKVSVFVSNQYILIPPSVRQEGPYRWVGEVLDAPPELIDDIAYDAYLVTMARAERSARAADRTGPDSVDRWAERTDWRELLEPDGWHYTGSTTSCGCPEVTAPGVHASPKSATAHEVGCRETDTSSGHGPLHIWTDNPPAPLIAYITRPNGSKTMTKLQYVSWMHHGGDDGAAIRALGITSGHLLGGPKSPISAADIQARFAEANL
jgi:hypothetical protein